MKRVMGIVLLMVLMFNNAYAYDSVSTAVIINKQKYIKLHIDCDQDGECVITSPNDGDLRVIAKLKSFKSWIRIFKSNDKYLKIFKNEKYTKEQIASFIICNSRNSRMIDSSYGVEILYKDMK